MRSLIVTPVTTGRSSSGGELRIDSVTHALACFGDVDVFVLYRGADEAVEPRQASRFGSHPMPMPPPGTLSMLRSVVSGGLPSDFHWNAKPAKDAVSRWVAGRQYDLAWFATPWTWQIAAGSVDCHRVLDLWDRHDVLVRAEAALGAALLPGRPWWRERARELRLRVDAHRWKHLLGHMIRSADTVVVCSNADRIGLNSNTFGDRVRVVLNTYPVPPVPKGRVAVSSSPTIAFVGQLRYLPNLDAARLLVEDIFPLVQQSLPATEVRLVGDAPRQVHSLAAEPSVTVTGFVDSVADELARADVVVAPIRYGGGTRLKILEAWAHRIPVVATSTAAEGLHAVDGRHLLLGDTAAQLASACVRLLTDFQLRQRVTDEAEQLYRERFTPERTDEGVAELIRERIEQPLGR